MWKKIKAYLAEYFYRRPCGRVNRSPQTGLYKVCQYKKGHFCRCEYA